MKTPGKLMLLALAACLPLSASAHRAWMLPSATVLSGDKAWVTVDAAVSNDLFYFEHQPLRLDGLAVLAPDGKPVAPQHAATGRYRSTFDVELKESGTYKMAIVSDGLFASYKENGQTKRWRGSAQAFAQEVPANAQDLKVSHMQRRNETFVTAGKPTRKTLEATGSGLELLPITHPNDMVAGDPASFQFLLDGKPAAGIKVSVVPGGIRYRDKLNEMAFTTDQDGKFSVTWPQPGMYWMEADARDQNAAIQPARERRASYAVTLEVMPQ